MSLSAGRILTPPTPCQLDGVGAAGVGVELADVVDRGQPVHGGHVLVDGDPGLAELVQHEEAGLGILDGAAVLGQHDDGRGVPVAPVDPGHHAGRRLLGGLGDVVLAEAGVHQALETLEAPEDLLVEEPPGVALVLLEGRRQVRVLAGPGVPEDVLRGGVGDPLLPDPVPPPRRRGHPELVVVAGLAQRGLQDLRRVAVHVGRLVDVGEGEVQAAHGVGVVQRAEQDRTPVRQLDDVLLVVAPGDQGLGHQVEEGALGAVPEHGEAGGADGTHGPRVVQEVGDVLDRARVALARPAPGDERRALGRALHEVGLLVVQRHPGVLGHPTPLG